MAYTASALSLMLLGFKKPIVMTGSQLPLSSPRSDARQNLIDALTCAAAAFEPPHVTLNEVAVCFGGKLMRGNRAQKVDSSSYQVRIGCIQDRCFCVCLVQPCAYSV
eukprot:GHUV01042577.1.p2 GENE.GHUV01042577.1~~GHUV01042577.1.p2  ORF type:complete len:107 (+),score=13.71 GHUV01042577.1:276-596(+)